MQRHTCIKDHHSLNQVKRRFFTLKENPSIICALAFGMKSAGTFER